MFINVNNVFLYYDVIGKGLPLILLHGNGEDHNIFLEAVEKLKDYFTCYLIDSRDHGQSQKVEKLSYQDIADDVKAFIKELNLHNITIYGFSDGGIIGLLVASQMMGIQNLIVSGANLTPDGVSKRLQWQLRFYNFFKKDEKITLMLNEPWITDEDLSKIRAHTLVLAGEKDLIKIEQTKRIASGIENSQMKILINEDHGSYIIHNRKIADLICEFLNIK